MNCNTSNLENQIMKLRTLLLGLSLLIVPPSMAEPKVEYFTNDAMGCMMLQECTEDVEEVFSMADISMEYENWEDFTNVTNEFNNMLVLLNQMGTPI